MKLEPCITVWLSCLHMLLRSKWLMVGFEHLSPLKCTCLHLLRQLLDLFCEKIILLKFSQITLGQLSQYFGNLSLLAFDFFHRNLNCWLLNFLQEFLLERLIHIHLLLQ